MEDFSWLQTDLYLIFSQGELMSFKCIEIVKIQHLYYYWAHLKCNESHGKWAEGITWCLELQKNQETSDQLEIFCFVSVKFSIQPAIFPSICLLSACPSIHLPAIHPSNQHSSNYIPQINPSVHTWSIHTYHPPIYLANIVEILSSWNMNSIVYLALKLSIMWKFW